MKINTPHKFLVISTLFLSLQLLFAQKQSKQIVFTNVDSISETDQQPGTTTRSYYKNGQLKEIRNIVENNLHGSWYLYHENGSLKKKGSFKHGKPHGIWKKYDAKGTLLYVENYEEGLENGTWYVYYSNGLLKIKGEFVNGKRQGDWTTYSYSGKQKSLYVYHDNVIEKSIDLYDDTWNNRSELAGNL